MAVTKVKESGSRFLNNLHSDCYAKVKFTLVFVMAAEASSLLTQKGVSVMEKKVRKWI